MIHTPTAFVLGDGALHEFGFLSDRGVIQMAYSQLDERMEADKQKSERRNWIHNGLEIAVGLSSAQAFRAVLSKSAGFLPSIGRILEYKKDCREIGKLCLILATLKFEWNSGVGAAADSSDPNWLEFVIGRMIQPKDGILKSRVSFINFGHDRLIEHLLGVALGCIESSSSNAPVNPFADSSALVSEKSDRVEMEIPIIHPYGKIAELPAKMGGEPPSGSLHSAEYKYYTGSPRRGIVAYEWELPKIFGPTTYSRDDGVRSYRSDYTIDWMTHNILVYGEDGLSANEFSKAHSALTAAERIYLICLNYDEVNLERLGIHELKGKQIVGTDFGLGESEKRDLSARWNISFPGKTTSVLEFLKRFASLS